MRLLDGTLRLLPIRISESLSRLPEGILRNLNEIRLRKRAPMSITVSGRNMFFDSSGSVCSLRSALFATDSELTECVARLTEGSLYTCDESIAKGFIPLPSGGRAGICGKADYRAGRMTGFTEITSVDIRIGRFLEDLASPLIKKMSEYGVAGTLVCSPPACGKTTFLRSAAYLLSCGKGIEPRRVAVADERNEISVELPTVGLLDILSGIPKSNAVELLTRTMAPEIIICDEIGSGEVDSILEAQTSGVSLIASAHCITPADLMKRGRFSRLIESGVFPLTVTLGGVDGALGIHETEEFF